MTTADDSGPSPGPRFHAKALTVLSLATLAIHLSALTQYGWFRDELYYAASTDHLAWGYVEHPPLSIAVLWLVTRIIGESLAVVRLVPALLHATVVLLTGRIAYRLGGGSFAQALAALAAMFMPVFLALGHFYSMNALEMLFWSVATLVLLRILESPSRGNWIRLGVVLGLGLLNKISMGWFGAGLAIGLVLTPHRRFLATPGPYLAAVIAGVILLPHVIWQMTHDWPTLRFIHNATQYKMVSVSPVTFVLKQALDMGPGNLLIWTVGLGFGLFARAGSRGRILAWIYLFAFALLITGGRSRASYLSVAYPMLFGLGGVAWERITASGRRRALRGVLVGLAVAGGLVALPLTIPILPPARLIPYQAALGLSPSTEEITDVGPLSQQYADMFGWEDLVAKVAAAYATLTPEEKAHCRVFGQNYGEAGAVDVIGKRYGLPRAMSGHNSYWLWGPGDFDGSVLIIIGGDHEDNLQFFEEVQIVDRTDQPYAMPYERGLDISIARRAKVSLKEAWPRLRMYI